MINLHRPTEPITLFHLDLQLGPCPNHSAVDSKLTNNLMGMGSRPEIPPHWDTDTSSA